ncbi:unnamed protein product, partial [Pylaiella littoralis]
AADSRASCVPGTNEMRFVSTTVVFVAIYYQRAGGFVVPGGFVMASKLVADDRSHTLAMSAESSGPTSRGQAIAAAATGLLATFAGVSAAGAATVPEALPACPTDGNCVSSTSFKLVMQGRYMAPWSYTGDTQDVSAAFAKLLAAVEKDPQLKLVDQDAEGLYILAKAKSAVPPDGFDKVEFLFKPADGLVSFRSKSAKNVYAGPVLVGDGGSNRNSRLEALRKRLGWPEQGIDNYMRDQGIDSGTTRAKGYLSELGWRQGETQSYGEEDEY